MQEFEPLIGTWDLSGEANGTITFRWAEGRRFLLQDFEIQVFGRTLKGLEVIGRLHPLRQEPSSDVCSRAYVYTDGSTLDYVYEMTGNDLTIWFGRKGSDNFMKGRVDPVSGTMQAAWQWPGGGYGIVGTRRK